MKLAFRSILLSVISILLTVGVANAVGVFYYDSVNNTFVVDGDLNIMGSGKFQGAFREIGSAPDSDLYINSQQDLNVQLGSGANTRFGINSSFNSRIFQVSSTGVLQVGDNLDAGNQGRPSKVNLSVDSSGNAQIAGAIKLAGGLSSTGVTLSNQGWDEKLRLASSKNGFINWINNNLAFGFSDSAKGFYWADTSAGTGGATVYPMILSSSGALTVKSKVTSPKYKLGGVEITAWSQILSGSYATETSVNSAIKTQSVGQFGGMFAYPSGSGSGATTPVPGCRTGSIGNPLVQNECACPEGFENPVQLTFSDYYPKVYYCYKLNP